MDRSVQVNPQARNQSIRHRAPGGRNPSNGRHLGTKKRVKKLQGSKGSEPWGSRSVQLSSRSCELISSNINISLIKGTLNNVMQKIFAFTISVKMR